MNLDLIITLTLITATAGLAVLFGWLGARPLDLKRGPRMAPYRLLMMLSAVATVIAATHLVSLLETSH
jgi:hypothetical protein